MSAHIDEGWAEELHEAEREALQEMRALLKSDDAKLRFKAAEAIFKFADRCRRNEARAAKAESLAPAVPDAPDVPAAEKVDVPKPMVKPKSAEKVFDRPARSAGPALLGAVLAGETPAPPG